MTVTALANGMFDVTSERDETVSYVVSLAAVSCTCPDWRARRAEKELDDPQRLCKHARAAKEFAANQPAPTALRKAATVAQTLSDADLQRYAAEKAGTAAACACLLELAKRQQEDLIAADYRAHLRAVLDHEEATAPKPIPAGIECFLQGATEAERERALACYRS